MAKIVGMNKQYIKVQMKNGTFEVYSKECIDWEPELGQEIGFMADEDGNVFIDLKERIPAGEEYIPEAEKVVEHKTSHVAAKDIFEDDEEEAAPVRKTKKKRVVEEEEEEEEKPVLKHKRRKEEDYEDEEEFDDDEFDDEPTPFFDSPVFLILGIVFGIVAIVAAVFVSKLKILGLIAGAIGIVIGIVGFLKSSKKPLAVISIVLGVVAIVLCILLNGDGRSAATSVVSTPVADDSEEEVETPTPTPEIAEAATDNIRTGFYSSWSGITVADTVITVTNTSSSPIYLDGGDIIVSDSDGSEIVSESSITMCPKILEPGETGYVQALSGGIELGDYYEEDGLQVTADLDFEFVEGDAVAYDWNEAMTSYSVDGSGYPYIIGTFTNNSGADDSNVTVQVMFFDGNGDPIGVTEGIMEEFADGDTVQWEVYGSDLPYSFLNVGISDYYAYAMKAAK